LHESARKHLAHGFDELLYERGVGLAAQPRLVPADVLLVVQQRLVVGADVEADGQRLRGMYPAAGAVERELADRDCHAARTLVADPEDGLVVRDNEQLRPLPVRRATQHLSDASLEVGRDPHAAAAAEHRAEAARREPDRRCVDDGHELFQVVAEDAVEQVLVAILQSGKLDVLLERIVVAADGRVDAPGLHRHRDVLARQQALETEGGAFRRRKARALVQQ
jgi:hypothetical protein